MSQFFYSAYYGFNTIKPVCASVRASVPSNSNAFSLATTKLILIKFGTKVGTDNGFKNPENHDDRSHSPDSML